MSGTITMTGEEYDALHAEAEAMRAENVRLKAELSGVLTGIATESQAADHYRTQLEAARGLLRDMRHAATINPSCQFGMANPCRCMFCVGTRVNAFLTATPAPEASVVSQQFTAEQGERQEAACWVPRACLDKLRNGRNNSPTVLTDGPAEFNDTPLYTTPQPSQDVQHGDGDLTLTPAAQAILTECIGAHAYVLQAIVNGRPDLALTEAKKWVDGFKQAADHHRQAQRQA